MVSTRTVAALLCTVGVVAAFWAGRRLWTAAGVELVTSTYALEEARRNLVSRLELLASRMEVLAVDVSDVTFPAKLAQRWMPGLFPERPST